MVFVCVVPGCTQRRTKEEQRSFHSFPFSNPARCDDWIKCVSRGSRWRPSKHSRICSDHFVPTDYVDGTRIKTLKTTAIPTQFPPDQPHKQPRQTSSGARSTLCHPRRKQKPETKSTKPPSKRDSLELEHSFAGPSTKEELQQVETASAAFQAEGDTSSPKQHSSSINEAFELHQPLKCEYRNLDWDSQVIQDTDCKMEALRKEYQSLCQKFRQLKKLASINLDLLFLVINEEEAPQAWEELGKIKVLVQTVWSEEEELERENSLVKSSSCVPQDDQSSPIHAKSLDQCLDELALTFTQEEVMTAFNRLLERSSVPFSVKVEPTDWPVNDESEVQSQERGSTHNWLEDKECAAKLNGPQSNCNNGRGDENAELMDSKTQSDGDGNKISGDDGSMKIVVPGSAEDLSETFEIIIMPGGLDGNETSSENGESVFFDGTDQVMTVLDQEGFGDGSGDQMAMVRMAMEAYHGMVKMEKERDVQEGVGVTEIEDDFGNGNDRTLAGGTMTDLIQIDDESTENSMEMNVGDAWSVTAEDGSVKALQCMSHLDTANPMSSDVGMTPAVPVSLVKATKLPTKSSNGPTMSSNGPTTSGLNNNKENKEKKRSKQQASSSKNKTTFEKTKRKQIRKINLLEKVEILSMILESSSGKICPICSFEYKGSFSDHIKCHQDKVRETTVPEDTETHESERFLCTVCGKILNNKSTLHGHLRSHREAEKGELFRCNICNKTFVGKTALGAHRRSVHRSSRSVICDICGKMFKTRYNMILHQKAVHMKLQSASCTVCKKSFAHKTNLHRHMRIHRGELRYMCSVCGKRFSCSSSRNSHEFIHSGKYPHPCLLCNVRGFVSPHLLRKHMQVHTKQRANLDDQTGVVKKRRRRRRHFTEQSPKPKGPFPCTTCGKVFSETANLSRHMFTHTGLKPFKCSTCERCFNTADALRLHSWTHSELKKFPCQMCDKGFNDKRNYRAHVLRVHPEHAHILPEAKRRGKGSQPQQTKQPDNLAAAVDGIVRQQEDSSLVGQLDYRAAAGTSNDSAQHHQEAV